MLTEGAEYRRMLAQFPDAAAVFVVGDSNQWCTGRTPMQRRSDGLWEVLLPEDAEAGRAAFSVCQVGHIGGELRWSDRPAA